MQQSQVKDLIEEQKIIQTRRLFFVSCPSKLCSLPYPGHPKGCPNIIKNIDHKIPLTKKNKNCPPFASRIEDKYDLQKPYFLAYVKFNIKLQKQRMKSAHADWTDKQCKCLLYWQGTVKKALKEYCDYYMKEGLKTYYLILDPTDYELIPEAMGLQVFETMECHGIKLEKHPENYVYKIAFIGVLK